MCRTWTSLCLWDMGSDSLSLPSCYLFHVPIPLAPVKFSFSHSPCLSQPLKGIAVGHVVSLPPLSALSIPLLHSSCLRGCLFKPQPHPRAHPPNSYRPLPRFASLESVPNIALSCSRTARAQLTQPLGAQRANTT